MKKAVFAMVTGWVMVSAVAQAEGRSSVAFVGKGLVMFRSEEAKRDLQKLQDALESPPLKELTRGHAYFDITEASPATGVLRGYAICDGDSQCEATRRALADISGVKSAQLLSRSEANPSGAKLEITVEPSGSGYLRALAEALQTPTANRMREAGAFLTSGIGAIGVGGFSTRGDEKACEQTLEKLKRLPGVAVATWDMPIGIVR